MGFFHDMNMAGRVRICEGQGHPGLTQVLRGNSKWKLSNLIKEKIILAKQVFTNLDVIPKGEKNLDETKNVLPLWASI